MIQLRSLRMNSAAFLFVASLLGTISCSAAEDAAPAAPVIRNLKITPNTVTAAKLGEIDTIPTVTGTLDYTDVNADVIELESFLESEGKEQPKNRLALKSSSGARDGRLSFRLTIATFVARSIRLHACVYDRAGQASNELVATIEVTKP